MSRHSPAGSDEEQGHESPLRTIVRSQLSSLGRAVRVRFLMVVFATAVCLLFFAMTRMLSLSPVTTAISFLALFFPVFIGGMVWAFRMRAKSREARRAVSAHAFAGLAQTQEPYMGGGQRFAGSYEGRNFDAYLTQIRDSNQVVTGGVYDGENLDIFVDTTVMVRLGAGLADRTVDAVNKRLQPGTFLLDELKERGVGVRGTDKEWSERAVKNHAIADEFVYLVTENPLGGIRSLTILPGQIKLTMRRIKLSSVTHEQIQDVMASLMRLAQAIETLPPPTVVEKMTAVEKLLRGDRKKLKKLAYLILAVVLGVPSLLLIAFCCLLFYLDAG
ncbi:hypothetical protein CSA57_12270 [candidate division KSB3 bacterium]|nr:MAG: hypothetical protein CSA57_12270 [candidate division KSB3 bacterium]